MCIICIDLAKKTLTAAEGRRALGEMRGKLGPEHAAEVEAKLDEAEKADPPPKP
jgi:hypothetical protein